jgi:phosphoribosylamine--glycine ligase
MKSDIVPVLLATIEGNLKDVEIEWHEGAALCVVMVSEGYPGAYETGKPIEGLEEVSAMEDVEVFHAGTREEGGKMVTAGGRVLGVTARGANIKEAQQKAYDGVKKIRFEGAHYRTDIGWRAVGRD